jgi:hypothetical protein
MLPQRKKMSDASEKTAAQLQPMPIETGASLSGDLKNPNNGLKALNEPEATLSRLIERIKSL